MSCGGDRDFPHCQAVMRHPGADHLARFVAELVDEHLDLSRFLAVFTEGRGALPYEPRVMLRILIYGYCTGARSSRKLEAACTDLVALRWLAAGAAPDYRFDRPVRYVPRHDSGRGRNFGLDPEGVDQGSSDGVAGAGQGPHHARGAGR
jgi:hypothetical protein